ncbi:MAG: 3-hydroxyacyl-CoA dehydrogenase family protein [Solirubrobacteraceae bacterium]
MRAAVLGAGVMGSNIARVLLQAGHEVALFSRSSSTLELARSALGVRHRAGAEFVSSIPEAVAGASVVIESVPESLALKHRVLAEAEEAAPQDAVLATNTSSLSLARLAEPLRQPERFLGWHWFNPAHLIPLVEVVPTAMTEAGVVDWSLTQLKAAGKRPTLAPAIEGFLVNRLQYALIREALALVDSGLVTPEQIDAALTDCLGLRWAVIGPMRSTDLAGVPTAVAVAGQLYPQLSNAVEPQAVLTDLQRRGRLGAAAGAGFYDYPPGSEPAAERDRGLERVLAALTPR